MGHRKGFSLLKIFKILRTATSNVAGAYWRRSMACLLRLFSHTTSFYLLPYETRRAILAVSFEERWSKWVANTNSKLIRQLADQSSKLENNSSVNSAGGSAMGRLLASQTAKVNAFHEGDQVKGTITKLTRSEILVDMSGKTEAIVLEKDKKLLGALMSLLHVGDVVTVTILNPESDMGNPVVSLRRFLEEHAWNKLSEIVKNQETVECTVSEMTKGGYILSMPYGLSGFLPHSHAQTSTQLTIGKKIPVSIIDLHKADKKIILSQKKFLTKEEFDTLRKQLGVGNTVDATITNVTSFGIFVSLPQQLDGFIHASEIAWEKTTDPIAQFSIGQVVAAKVVGFDTEAKRGTLSI